MRNCLDVDEFSTNDFQVEVALELIRKLLFSKGLISSKELSKIESIANRSGK